MSDPSDRDEIGTASHRFYVGVNRILQGDAEPVIACWSETDDVTYLDLQGNLHQEHAALVAYYSHAAHLNAAGGPTVVPDIRMAQVSGDLVFTIVAAPVTARRGGSVTVASSIPMSPGIDDAGHHADSEHRQAKANGRPAAGGTPIAARRERVEGAPGATNECMNRAG